MEKNEKRKLQRSLRIQFSRQLACILQSMLEKAVVREEAKNCHAGDPMFETVCDYVNLRYEIRQLKITLSNLADYTEILIDKDF